MDITVWWASLTAAESSLLDMLDAVERARVSSLDRPADRARSLLGAALLRVAAAERMAVSPGEVVVDRTCGECGGPHGAPHIIGPGSPRHWVSVSHSGLLVVVAVSGHAPVGVDVQRLSDLHDSASGPQWVRKEALFKARTAAQRTRAAARHEPDTAAPVFHQLSAPLDGYAAALVAMTARRGEVAVRHWPQAAAPH